MFWLKIILTLHDAVCASRKVELGYLRRSAGIPPPTRRPTSCWQAECCGPYARLWFAAAGPIYYYCNERSLGVKFFALRARSIYYDQFFAEILYRELLLLHADASCQKFLGSFASCAFPLNLNKQFACFLSSLQAVAGKKHMGPTTFTLRGSWKRAGELISDPHTALVAYC